MQTLWENRFAHRTTKVGSSVIRELLKLTEQPDIISFSGGLPAPAVFPIEKFQEACNTILQNDAAQALQYGTTEGYIPLREMISRHTARSGLKTTIENILITSGSQQALDFIGRLMLNRGDYVVVESPTYLGALMAWNVYGAQYITVPTDEHGMIVDELEKALRVGPKFIYILPNFQNPSGATLSLERREQLIKLADQYGVPIVEDDPYGQLRYEGTDIPSVIKLDSDYRSEQSGRYDGNVIYTSTYSKLLAPGLRLGWVVAPPAVIKRMVMIKQAADLHTSTLNQHIAYEVAKGGFLDEHVKLIRATYKERRDVMLDTMDEIWPQEVKYHKPEGGMFLWSKLPKEMDAAQLLIKAVEKKVAFVPGGPFHPNGGNQNTLRINFSYSDPETIREGITRLGLLFREEVINYK